MFYNSGEFKTLEAGIKMSWMQHQIHSQNIANIETPGYKSKNLVFRQVLSEKAKKASLARVSASVQENKALSNRNDGNNVDLEKENIELYKSYVQYAALLNKVNGKFDQYSYVLNSNFK